MTTKEYVNEIKSKINALQYHIYKSECFCETCANCRMQMICQHIIRLERMIRELEQYV